MPDEIVVPPTTETISAPPITPIDSSKATLELYDRILAEKEEKIRNLEARVNAPTPVTEVPPDSAAYFADPFKHMSDLMDKKLSESVAPLNAFVNQQRRRQALDNYRNIAAQDPRVAKFWPHISANFDQLGSKWIENNEVNESVVVETIKSLIANYAMTSPLEYAALIGSTATPPTSTVPKVITPPSIPPSSTEPPVNVDPNKAPTLSENEMRLARERWPEIPSAEAYKKYDSLRNPGSFVVVPRKKGDK